MAEENPSHYHSARGGTKSRKWLTLAVWSGAFAALNGVFAKLTTTSQTQSIATAISQFLGFTSNERVIEILTRGIFLALNFLSNAVMWILFTKALTAALSSTRVSILNVSANFLFTAVLGKLVFSEGLPAGWWFGACLLVAGSVVIGRRQEEAHPAHVTAAAEYVPLEDTVYSDADDASGESSPTLNDQSIQYQGKFGDDPGVPGSDDEEENDGSEVSKREMKVHASTCN